MYMNIVAAEPSSLQTTDPLTLGIQGMRHPFAVSAIAPKIGTVRDRRDTEGLSGTIGLKNRAGIRPALLEGVIDFDLIKIRWMIRCASC